MLSKKTTILAADDDPQLLNMIADNLRFDDYEVLTACNGQQALKLIEQHLPDLVLLDVMMPKMDGFTVCQRVRGFSSVPIIMVTARGMSQDKVKGLDLGADDYLIKPFSTHELMARIRAVLRRAQLNPREPRALPTQKTIGALWIDFTQRIVSARGKEIELTPTEYRMLAYLAQHTDRVVSHAMLLEQVWGAEYVGEGHMLQVNINRLRRKIEPDYTHPSYILTKNGVGYLLCSAPETSDTTRL